MRERRSLKKIRKIFRIEGRVLGLGLDQEMGSQPKNPLDLIRFEVGKNIGFPKVNEGGTLEGPGVISHVDDVVLAEELVDLGYDKFFVHGEFVKSRKNNDRMPHLIDVIKKNFWLYPAGG